MTDSPQTTIPELSEDQTALFHEQGFLTIPDLAPPEEIAAMHGVFERLFEQRAGREEGAQFEMVGHDEDGATPRLSQILRPMSFAPELQQTIHRKRCLAIARQLLGPTAVETCDHAILKPAGYGAPTPWHQDEASRDSGFVYDQLSIWMPLQEATLENGCMQYVPGTHRGEVLDHASPDNDPRVHTIECVGEFDRAAAVACPMPAGGAVMHLGRTLHYAGANKSQMARYAYVMMYETPPVASPAARDFYWNRDKKTARLDRRARFWRRGGVAVVFWRTVRANLFRSPWRIAFEVGRLLRLVGGRLLSR